MWRLMTPGKLHLHQRLLEPLLDRFFRVRGPGSEPLFQNFWAGRREEEEAGLGEGGVVCYLFYALLVIVS